MGYQSDYPLKPAVFRSLLRKKGVGSFRDIASEYDPIEVVSAITKSFQTDSIDDIIDVARR